MLVTQGHMAIISFYGNQLLHNPIFANNPSRSRLVRRPFQISPHVRGWIMIYQEISGKWMVGIIDEESRNIANTISLQADPFLSCIGMNTSGLFILFDLP